jgi:hypothetical protein
MPEGINPPSHMPRMPRVCGRMAAKSRSAYQRLRVRSQAAAARHRRLDGRGDGSGGGGGAAQAIEDPKIFARLRRAELFSRLRRAQAAPAAHDVVCVVRFLRFFLSCARGRRGQNVTFFFYCTNR